MVRAEVEIRRGDCSNSPVCASVERLLLVLARRGNLGYIFGLSCDSFGENNWVDFWVKL